MKKPCYHIIQLVCLAVLFSAVMLQGFTHIVKLKPLGGVVAKEKPVKLNFKTYLDSSYQDYLNEHAKRNTGFREFFIRNYNQLCFSCFGKTTNKDIIICDNGELFTRMYFDDLSGKRITDNFGSIDSAKMAARANTEVTLRLMDTLKRHGTDFLFVFAPSKAAVYPEYVPQFYRDQFSDFSLIEYYIQLFKEKGIPHIDFYNHFKAIKDTFPYPLYSKYGTHWAFSTIPMVADSILRMMDSITGKHLPSIMVTDFNLTTDYFSQDLELENTLNLLFPLDKSAIPSPIFTLTDTLGADKPNLVVVGDSYFVAFEKTCFLDAFSSWNYLKYNEYVISSNPKYNWKEIQYLPEAYEILENADIVMAIFTAPMLYDFMFGFPDLVSHIFEKGQLYEEDKIEMKIQAIRNIPEWYDAVVKQAEELGLTIEENLRRNAIYLIQIDEKNNP